MILCLCLWIGFCTNFCTLYMNNKVKFHIALFTDLINCYNEHKLISIRIILDLWSEANIGIMQNGRNRVEKVYNLFVGIVTKNAPSNNCNKWVRIHRKFQTCLGWITEYKLQLHHRRFFNIVCSDFCLGPKKRFDSRKVPVQ